jgi:hypothetical protein
LPMPDPLHSMAECIDKRVNPRVLFDRISGHYHLGPTTRSPTEQLALCSGEAAASQKSAVTRWPVLNCWLIWTARVGGHRSGRFWGIGYPSRFKGKGPIRGCQFSRNIPVYNYNERRYRR